MKHIIEFSTMPLGTNNLYAHRGRHRFLTSKAKDNKHALAMEARSQYRGAPMEGPLSVKIDLWWPTRANHDVDNIKVLLDALTGILWLDDGQIVELGTRKGYEKGKARVILTVEPGLPLEERAIEERLQLR